jgi:hypothetical protein
LRVDRRKRPLVGAGVVLVLRLSTSVRWSECLQEVELRTGEVGWWTGTEVFREYRRGVGVQGCYL